MNDRLDTLPTPAALDAVASIAGIAAIEGLTVLRDEPLAPRTTWKIGGPAKLLVEVSTATALVALLQALTHPTPIRWSVLGNGSNVLVSDRGFDGAVLVLTGELARIGVRRDAFGPGRHAVDAGAGASITRLLRTSKDEALGGLWVLGGVPGTVGGAVKMNAGTRWGEVKDLLHSVQLATPNGLDTVPVETLGLAYRHSSIAADTVIASATFVVGDADPATRDELDRVLAHRKATQPLQLPSCGSVFANPPGDSAGRLIEAAGLKGHRIGDLEVSPQHANWIVNHGQGTAADALALIDLIRDRVRAAFGVELRPEVQRFGDFTPVATSEVAP